MKWKDLWSAVRWDIILCISYKYNVNIDGLTNATQTALNHRHAHTYTHTHPYSLYTQRYWERKRLKKGRPTVFWIRVSLQAIGGAAVGNHVAFVCECIFFFIERTFDGNRWIRVFTYTHVTHNCIRIHRSTHVNADKGIDILKDRR